MSRSRREAKERREHLKAAEDQGKLVFDFLKTETTLKKRRAKKRGS